MRVHYAIVFVSDMKRSISYYRDVIGLPLRFESSHWTEFATEGATLALHLSDVESVHPADDQKEPAGRCRPGFSVQGLDSFHARMRTNNVPCVQAPTTVFGERVAQYLDPDGLVISVSEDRAGATQTGRD